MIRPAKYDLNLGLGTCINCSFYTCINNAIPFDESWQSIYILKTRTSIWVPVDLQRPWQQSPTLYVIEEILKNLKHVKHFLGLLTAAILGIIAITTMAAIAGMALHKSVQIVHFIQEWHKDADVLWTTQQKIDGKLASQVADLQQSVITRRSISQFTKTGETKM